jgi:hypothetical protein
VGIDFSMTLVTWHHIPEDSYLQRHHSGNLKPHVDARRFLQFVVTSKINMCYPVVPEKLL